jgi:hypothetical protein
MSLLPDSKPSETAPAARDLQKDATELVQVLGQTLNMVLLYGAGHRVTLTALERTFPVIPVFIEYHGAIHFSVSNEELLVNGLPVPDAPLAASLARRLAGLSLLSFVIEAGFTLQEYEQFYALLAASAASVAGKTAAELVGGAGLQHLQAQNVTYRRVSEESAQAEAAVAAAVEQMTPLLPDLDNVMAFLKGEPTADANRSAEAIRELASDAEKLAELILRAVELRSTAADLASGESLADLVVGCVGKVVGELGSGPATKSHAGRRQMKRSLLLLEKTLVDQLRALAGDDAADRAAALIEEQAEALDTETLIAKYARSRRDAEASTAKLKGLIERVGDDPQQVEELRGRLAEQGVGEQDWQELVLHRGPETGAAADAGPGPGGGGGAGEIRRLTSLLSQLAETVQGARKAGQPAAPAPAVGELAAEASREVAALAENTERKIEVLRTMLAGTAPADGAPLPRLTRQEILEVLAEIAQELAQPLTVVNATLGMMLEHAGPENAVQTDLLRMAEESGARMGHLVNCLIRIAGTPTTLRPDKRILGALYENASNDVIQPHI